MDPVALGIGTNLASTLLSASGRLFDERVFGGPERRALKGVLRKANAVMLVGIARHDQDRELPERLCKQFDVFFSDPSVAETIVGDAFSDEPPPFDELRGRFRKAGYDPDDIPGSFEEAMGVLVREVAEELKREASRDKSPLANLVRGAQLERIDRKLDALGSSQGEKHGPDEPEREARAAARREAIWEAYQRVPDGADDDVVFAGFFVPARPEGNLTRGGNSRSMELSFLDAFAGAMAEHRLNSSGVTMPGVELPIRALDRRPPEGFAETRDYEGFAELAGRWAEGCLGVVWGVLREDGKVERFEVAVDPNRYHGGPIYERGLERVRRVAERDDLPHRAAVRYLAKALAAIWCQGYCDALNRAGRWDEAIPIVADSERLLREALEELEEDAGDAARSVVEAQRKALLPQVIRQEAASLWHGGHRVGALDGLFGALKLDPWGPIGGRENFREYYNNRYAFSLASRYDDFDDFLAARYGEGSRTDEDRASAFAGRAFAGLPPFDLELFTDWISRAAQDGEDLADRVEGWFSELSSLYPDNPFVLLYWGDALDAVATAKHGALMDRPEARLWDPVADKYKRAYALTPRLEVAAVRAQAVILPTAYPLQNTTEGERRVNEAFDLSARGRPFFERYAPWALREGEGTPDDLGEWVDNRQGGGLP